MSGHGTQGQGRRIFWRSLEHKAERDRFADEASGSDIVKQTVDAGDLLRVNRRNFVTLSGAMAALTGLGGCIRRPEENILPYTSQPEVSSPGAELHYATAIERQGEALGLLVTAHAGRPIKIEGNPSHPASLGATDVYTQAEILELYDSDRMQKPASATGGPGDHGEASWADVDNALAAAAAGGGQGVRILAQPSNSPTFLALRDKVKAALPNVVFHTYTPVNQSNALDGARLAFGKPLHTVYDYAKAKVVLSLDSDFLLTEQGSVRAAKQFAAGRQMASASDTMNRLYVVEPSLSVTGSNADHRLRLAGSHVAAFAAALAGELSTHGLNLGSLKGLGGAPPAGVDGAAWNKWIKVVAKDLAAHRGECLVTAGARQPAGVHGLVLAINRALGNAGKTISHRPATDPLAKNQYGDIADLTKAIRAGQVRTLIVLGGNPVYDAPADVGFAEALGSVERSIVFASTPNETSALAKLSAPQAHCLEAWGDQRSLSGEYSIQQPLISPLWYGRSDIEVLSALAGQPGAKGYDLVRATAAAEGHGSEYAFRKLLHAGVAKPAVDAVLAAPAIAEGNVAAAARGALKAGAVSADSLELVFLPDNKVLDGRYANNSWLLELPDPITRIVWDNAALIAPTTADALGIENGDMIKVTLGERSIEIVAWKQPGQAPHSIGLPLGWGRRVVGPGGYGYGSDEHDVERRGFDVYPLRTTAAAGYATGARIEKLDRQYALSQTQDHDLMRDPRIEDEDRPLAIDATLAEYRERPNFAEWRAPDPSVGPLWKTVDYTKGLQWGMVIDLNACTGCSACVIACQAENNVPVVGKDQVARGREMHWFRIDRYYVGEDTDEPDVSFQPVGCQHCEEAPCENVCPVAATAHSPEGLNDIAYNRCVGTRYCMNNCPYKVRRFNFLNFNKDIPETLHMQRNPQVTNRFRGVIEKCSYCVQRIQNGKIKASREQRPLRDGEVKSACQQVCPSDAIAFGDLNDPETEVAKKRAIDRNYGLLTEIGTRPRTRFLGKVRNPNPEMQA
ncbi:MAG: 4Fe-4S dicluster domain-containing protein [Myxococcales bacterium]|nr:4Fe-4S dicluster domain-containing protein [Myxococcales bacterium]